MPSIIVLPSRPSGIIIQGTVPQRLGLRWPDDELSGKRKVTLRTPGTLISRMAKRIRTTSTTATTNASCRCVQEDDGIPIYL
ncbi:MAG: hypothetical protein HY754_14990 [Nitrospirae bacterium]|nr:hypothetical protein [Nitrospirota bacterium]